MSISSLSHQFDRADCHETTLLVNPLKRNLVANLIGGAWSSVLSLIFIPTYIRYLGVEAYGLIGFYATLQAIFGLFDLGLGSTLNRGMARLSAGPFPEEKQRDLLRTFEVVYHLIAVLLAVVLVAGAPLVARHWVHVQNLPMQQVITAIRLMALITAFQFPFALYQAGFLGLQRQVLLNAIAMSAATLRAGGGVLVLIFVERSIVGFFAWQGVVTVLQTGTMFLMIWKILGRIRHARIDWRILGAEWKFTASISANSLVAALITQADKIILSGLAPLQDLGYYSIAGTVAAALWFVILPVNTAVFPRLTQLIAAGDEPRLADVFHKACQTVALLVLPAGVTLALFARLVVEIWTGNRITAEHAALIVPLLATGTTLYGLSSVPAYLQFAAGWPQLTLYTNIVAAVVLIPITAYAVSVFGAVGAALAWLLINAAYFVPATIMFRRVVRTERRRWYVRDVAQPLAAACVTGVVARWLQPTFPNRVAAAAYLAAVGIAIFAVVLAFASDIRPIMLTRIRELIGGRAVATGAELP